MADTSPDARIAALLALDRDLLRRRIVDYIAAVLPCVPMADCVLDLALLASDRLTVVELNPFARSTGAALFDWTADHAALHGTPGGGPVPLRVREEVLPNIEDCLLAVFPATSMRQGPPSSTCRNRSITLSETIGRSSLRTTRARR